MKSIQEFIKVNNIKVTCNQITERKDDIAWPEGSTHWNCKISHKENTMFVTFSQGSAISGEPEAAEVLNAVACDAASYNDAKTFEDFADELGYDPDSRKAEKIYNACGKSADNLKTLLGPELYEALLYDTEHL